MKFKVLDESNTWEVVSKSDNQKLLGVHKEKDRKERNI